MAYYGMEHRGHLYFPGSVPHTPQSLGSGFFRGGDGSALEDNSGSAAGSAALGAVGSGETAPSMAGCGTGLSWVGMVSLAPPPFCPRLIALLCCVFMACARDLTRPLSLGFVRDDTRLSWSRTRSVPIRCEIGRSVGSGAGKRHVLATMGGSVI